MFDLLEEELTSKEESPRTVAKTPPPIDAVVYTMPEKFRRGATKSNSKSIIIIVGIVFLLAITGGVLFFVFSAPQEKSKPAVTEQGKAEQPPEEQEKQPVVEEQQPTGEQPAISEEPSATSTEREEQGAVGQESLVPAGAEPAVGEQPAEVKPTPTQLPSIPATDSDQDAITDAEERLYNTNSQIQDTDGDGFTDGEEVEHLFDPIRADGARLEISGRVTPYTNPTFSYSLYYPSSWSARAVNDSDREVVISSALGEFISVKVQDNPQSLGAIDWYVALVDPSADTSQLQTLSFNNWTGVMAPDGLAAYLVKTDETGKVIAPYVYSFLYNQNTSAQPQFQTSFRMMLRSFVFTDLSFVR